jgi:hypothetical protein
MSRSALKVLLLFVLAAAGWVGLWLYEGRYSAAARETQAKADTDEKSAQLRGIAGRLDIATRVARVIVTDQQAGPDGVRRTTLLWMEYARDRRDLLPAKRFVLDGTSARVGGKVIRFQGSYAADREPLTARSLLLFTSIAGDKQAATAALPIDPPGGTPDVYKGLDPRLPAIEAPHWQDFWKLAQDPQYAATAGVPVRDGEAVLPEGFVRGQVYTISLDADGALNIRPEPADASELEAIEGGARRGG